MSDFERTLCAWCGEPVEEPETRVRFNGDYICLECYRLHKKVRRANWRFWEGVKERNGQLRPLEDNATR